MAQIAFLALACLRAYRTVYIAILCLGLGAVILVLASNWPRWAVVWTLGWVCSIVAIHWMLLVVHEVVHLIALYFVGLPVESVRIARYKVVILYRGGSTWARSLVSVSGPVVAFVTGMLLTVGLISTWPEGASWHGVVRFRGSPWPLDLSIPLLMGLEHLVGLGPWAPDGKALWARSQNQGS